VSIILTARALGLFKNDKKEKETKLQKRKNEWRKLLGKYSQQSGFTVRHASTYSLAPNATPVRNDAPRIFASTYDNFIQTAGIGMVLPLRQASLGF
jgi:hypothetical protein